MAIEATPHLRRKKRAIDCRIYPGAQINKLTRQGSPVKIFLLSLAVGPWLVHIWMLDTLCLGMGYIIPH